MKLKNDRALPLSSMPAAVFCLLVACALSSFLAPGCQAEQKMIVAKQTHREFGKVTAYIAAQAVKVVNDERGFAFLAKAPKWDIMLYCDRRKLMHMFPSQGWRANGIKTALSLDDNDNYLVMRTAPEGRIKYAGVTANVLAFLETAEGSARVYKSGDYWIYRDSIVGPDARRPLCAVYGTQLQNGIPLRFRRLATVNFTAGPSSGELAKEQLTDYLWTSDVMVVPYNPLTFVEPKGYKEAPDSEVLLTKEDVRNGIDLLYGK